MKIERPSPKILALSLFVLFLFVPVGAQAEWAFASLNPWRDEDHTLSFGATGVSFWAYKAAGPDYFENFGIHSFHVNVALQDPPGRVCKGRPSFHFGFNVQWYSPQTASPSITGFMCDGPMTRGRATRFDIKLPRGGIETSTRFAVIQAGTAGKNLWKWEYWILLSSPNKWHYITTLYIDSPAILVSPNMNAEISKDDGIYPCNDRITPTTFLRVRVLKNGTWHQIPYLAVGYPRSPPPMYDCPAIDWQFLDSQWATVYTHENGRNTPLWTLWDALPNLFPTGLSEPYQE